MGDRKRRAVVLLGAGASVEYGIPSTVGFGGLIDRFVAKDPFCCSKKGDRVYQSVKMLLTNYYRNALEVRPDRSHQQAAKLAHFERIYHILHELAGFRATPGAASKFMPVMLAFLNHRRPYPEGALEAASSAMTRAIYTIVSRRCERPRQSLAPLSAFFKTLEMSYVPRVYTTNYDDFVWQATGHRYNTGFRSFAAGVSRFEPLEFWDCWDSPGVFHLHGSVHMGFPVPGQGMGFGDLAWYDSRAEARTRSEWGGSEAERLDGTGLTRSAIITGLDKLGRLQPQPFATYYAGFQRDVIEADLIVVAGSGLADIHLNRAIQFARARNRDLKLLYIDWWQGGVKGLFREVRFGGGDREIALSHDLHVATHNVAERDFGAVSGWTIDARKSSAVWADGFQSCLLDAAAMGAAMREISAA